LSRAAPAKKTTEVGVGRVGPPHDRSELGCRTKKSRAKLRPPRQKEKRGLGTGFFKTETAATSRYCIRVPARPLTFSCDISHVQDLIDHVQARFVTCLPERSENREIATSAAHSQADCRPFPCRRRLILANPRISYRNPPRWVQPYSIDPT
jgi:hypothetical protein